MFSGQLVQADNPSCKSRRWWWQTLCLCHNNCGVFDITTGRPMCSCCDKTCRSMKFLLLDWHWSWMLHVCAPQQRLLALLSRMQLTCLHNQCIGICFHSWCPMTVADFDLHRTVETVPQDNCSHHMTTTVVVRQQGELLVLAWQQDNQSIVARKLHDVFFQFQHQARLKWVTSGSPMRC